MSVVVGPANEGIEQLAKQGVRFDLAFLDADKGGYLGYYNQVPCLCVSKVKLPRSAGNHTEILGLSSDDVSRCVLD